MRGRSPFQSIASSPTMVGAITTLIVIVAVFLAYNANQGLPFVPTYRVSVELPNASRLIKNNEVRIGGHRVGVVESIEAVHPDAEGETETNAAATDQAVSTGTTSDATVARLNLKLDKAVDPLPQDSTFRVRYRSSFGLKYLEITRGDGEAAPEGHVFPVTQTVEQTEFDDINNTFDTETRTNSRTNLEGFGNAFAGRGTSLNQTIEALNPLFTNLKPVARVLAAPSTRLSRFFPELADAARIVAPVAEEQAELFTNMATTFAAISEDEEALKETISEGPPTLLTGIDVLPGQRVFLSKFARLSSILSPGVRDLRISLPTLNQAIDVGTRTLPKTVRMSRDLQGVFGQLRQLVTQPTTMITLQRLEETFDEATPLAEWVAPAQTVCNYWNYWFTFLTEHLTDRDQVGFNQRVVIVGMPQGDRQVQAAGGFTFTAPGETEAPLAGYSGKQANGIFSPTDEFQPYEQPILHGNPYGPTGQKGTQADCQAGQTGYALGNFPVPGQSPDSPAVGVSNLPGSRGPTTLFYDVNGNRQLFDSRVSGRYPNP